MKVKKGVRKRLVHKRLEAPHRRYAPHLPPVLIAHQRKNPSPHEAGKGVGCEMRKRAGWPAVYRCVFWDSSPDSVATLRAATRSHS